MVAPTNLSTSGKSYIHVDSFINKNGNRVTTHVLGSPVLPIKKKEVKKMDNSRVIYTKPEIRIGRSYYYASNGEKSLKTGKCVVIAQSEVGLEISTDFFSKKIVRVSTKDIAGQYTKITFWQSVLKKLFGAGEYVKVDFKGKEILPEMMYWLFTKSEVEPTLVQGYYSSDSQCYGFGFNTHDGGGFLPLSDITDISSLVPVTIIPDTN
jgi:hypothetical protein